MVENPFARHHHRRRFLTPRIQVTVTDPQTNTEYRVDFVWKPDDGRVIVAEYDAQ